MIPPYLHGYAENQNSIHISGIKRFAMGELILSWESSSSQAEKMVPINTGNIPAKDAETWNNLYDNSDKHYEEDEPEDLCTHIMCPEEVCIAGPCRIRQ
jgi:hypothetical protein